MSRLDYSEDLFADSRMSFGEHLEELRSHLLRAIYGLVVCLFLGFGLDGVGETLGYRWIGVGRPMMDIIKKPVEDQLVAFYDRRLDKLTTDAKKEDPDAVKATEPKLVKVGFPAELWKEISGKDLPEGESVKEAELFLNPLDLYGALKPINNTVRPQELTVLSVQEGLVVYFKVSLVCGFVLASPWVFWQLWSFVAAGLYPHEKHYVHKYLPISLGLFLTGVMGCQFLILPNTVGALLWFNEWLGFKPDLRLTEWLGFAIMMPVLTGACFQTPLVMLFLERLGILSVEFYWKQWRIAVFVMAVLVAVITPSPDAPTLLAIWIPMCFLYFLGIWLCRIAGANDPAEEGADDPVGV